MTSLGAALIGAGALDWFPPKYKVPFMVSGFVLTCLGTFFGGLVGQDSNPSTVRGMFKGKRSHAAKHAAKVLAVGLLFLTGCAYHGGHPDRSTPPWPRPLEGG